MGTLINTDKAKIIEIFDVAGEYGVSGSEVQTWISSGLIKAISASSVKGTYVLVPYNFVPKPKLLHNSLPKLGYTRKEAADRACKTVSQIDALVEVKTLKEKDGLITPDSLQTFMTNFP